MHIITPAIKIKIQLKQPQTDKRKKFNDNDLSNQPIHKTKPINPLEINDIFIENIIILSTLLCVCVCVLSLSLEIINRNISKYFTFKFSVQINCE